MTRFKDSDPSIRNIDHTLTKGLVGAGALAAVIAFGISSTTGSEGPKAESCSPLASINPDNMRSSSNGDHADAAMYQINNAIADVDAPQGIEYSYRNIDQQTREKLATFVVPMIERNDDPTTREIETGEVCVSLDDGEFKASVK